MAMAKPSGWRNGTAECTSPRRVGDQTPKPTNGGKSGVFEGGLAG